MNYLTLLEIADLLAELLDFDSVTAGGIDASLDETVGIYQRDDFTLRECIGGDSSYQTSKLRILVHWTNNPTEAEKKACEIAELFDGFRDMETKNHIIKFADLKAIRSIGKDEKGVCEYIVDADIIYTDKEEKVCQTQRQAEFIPAMKISSVLTKREETEEQREM